MDSEETVSNLNTLKEMILDEGKIVTYISISRDLSVHVNVSKLLLKRLLETIRKEDPKLQLNISYLVSGLLDKNRAKISVCSEDDLNETKKSFKVLFFEHIYSIGKGKSLTDHASLVSLNKYDDFNLCSGIIKNNYCNKRSSDELNILKIHSQEVISDDKKPIVQSNGGKKSVTKPLYITNNQNVFKNNNESSTNKDSHVKEIKKEVISPKKENIPKQNANKSSNKGIAGFFNKQNNNPKKKEVKAETMKTIMPKMDTHVEKECEEMDIDNNESKPKTKYEEIKENGVKENKVLNNIKKNSKVDKKRKRVLKVSDSDSDEDENDPFVEIDTNQNNKADESDDEIPPTPTANNLKITTGILNPRKKRKVVDKTYMSDDGYIVTKREEVYESCSDNENNTDEPTKKKIKEEKIDISPNHKSSDIKSTKKKTSPPQKGKQSSIMNFFKKS